MHGLANGEIRKNTKDMAVFQALEGADDIYPDGASTDQALHQLDQLAADKSKPFFLAAGILRPHLPFGAPARYLAPHRDAELPPTPHPTKPEGKTTWHKSGKLMNYQRWDRNPSDDAEFALEVRRHYAACVTYVDAQVGRLMDRLKAVGADDNTIIVVWGDHGWHLGEHAIWGKHALFEESLRSPLIIRHPGMKQSGKATSAVVETVDILPTLAELAELPAPEFADGQSLVPQLENPETPGGPAFAYNGSAITIRTDTHRLIAHKGGEDELYDHRTPENETKNLAEAEPELVAELRAMIKERLGRKP